MSLTPEALHKFLNGPSTKAPPGWTVNLENPQNRNGEVLAIAIICIFLTTSALLLRFYSRIFISGRLYLEDYIGLLAFLPYIGVAWCIFDFRNQAGFFVHQWDLRGYVLIKLGINAFVIGIVYSLVMLLLKTAVLLEWNRLFVLNYTHNAFFWISTTLIVLNVGLYFSAIFTDIFGCVPVEKSWHFWIAGKCLDRRARDIFNASFNLIMDVFIFILPQGMIWKLQMSGSRKFGISIVFSVGLLVIATACGRLYSTVTLDYVGDASKPTDRTYKFSATLLWAFSEITCIFLVFCVPAFPKLFAKENGQRRLPKPQWPPTIGSASSTPRRDAHGYEITDDTTDTQYSLTEVTTAQKKHTQYKVREGKR